jgi:integrase
MESFSLGGMGSRKKKLELGGAITPTPEAVAAATWGKELDWKFWYNKNVIPKWLNEKQVVDTTAMNTTAVSGSITPQLGTFSPWASEEIRPTESGEVVIIPTRKGLNLSLSNFDPVEPWLKSLPEKKRKVYQTALNRFCDFCKFTPMDLLVETREALFRFDPPPFRDRLAKWETELIDSKMRVGSVDQYKKRVRSFLNHYVGWIGRGSGTGRYGGSSIFFEPLKQSEVKAMIEVARKPHYKAVIAFLAQTGQRVAILAGIKWGIVDCEQWKPYGVASVPEKLEDSKGRTVRTGRPYTFVIGKDTMDFLDHCPETEKRKAEGTFVFGLSHRQIQRIVAEAAGDANVQADSKHMMPDKTILYTVHPDIFPTYWNGRVRDGDIPELQRKFMMGRDVSYEPRERDLFSADRLLAAYRKAEGMIAISE